MDIYITNSLTRKKELFKPINKDSVNIYTCGPTVYGFPQIGNYRTYTIADLWVKTFKYNSYETKYVMNLTDVGHLTGDNLGDADIGEDRIEEFAKKQGKSAWDIASYYSKEFIKDMKEMNNLIPDILPKATDHIKEQIELVKRIEEEGFAYKIKDGIYFDTKKYESQTGRKYGELSTLDKIKPGARVKENPDKKDPRDFALWKFSDKPGERQMEWESPWGLGFPGWHIECSAMSMKYLGDSFDVHLGGEDLRSTHHPNEIAQSEAATKKKFVNYWIHVTFLKIDGKRMGKSLGNAYTINDIKKKGFNPVSLRYLYLSAHYKEAQNFTWKSLEASEVSLENLYNYISIFRKSYERTSLSEEKQEKVIKFQEEYREALNNDLNTPKALAVLWKVIKSNIPDCDKYDLLISFDEVLSLGLRNIDKTKIKIPQEVKSFVDKRGEHRKKKDFENADKVRKQIEEKGYIVEDTQSGPVVKPINKQK